MLLPLRPPNYHLLDELAGGFRVRVLTVGPVSLDKSVAAIVELGDVSAKVFD